MEKVINHIMRQSLGQVGTHEQMTQYVRQTLHDFTIIHGRIERYDDSDEILQAGPLSHGRLLTTSLDDFDASRLVLRASLTVQDALTSALPDIVHSSIVRREVYYAIHKAHDALASGTHILNVWQTLLVSLNAVENNLVSDQEIRDSACNGTDSANNCDRFHCCVTCFRRVHD